MELTAKFYSTKKCSGADQAGDFQRILQPAGICRRYVQQNEKSQVRFFIFNAGTWIFLKYLLILCLFNFHALK